MSKRIYVNDDDVVYVPFRVARIKKTFSCLVPRKSMAFIVRDKKRLNVHFNSDDLYIADAKTPQVLIDLSMKGEESLFRATSLLLGHTCDKTIDHTYKIIQREYSKIRMPNEMNDFVDDVYNEDIKNLMNSERFNSDPLKSMPLCDFDTTIYD